jgi:hypothetical protein
LERLHVFYRPGRGWGTGEEMIGDGDGRKLFSARDESPPFIDYDVANACDSPAISVRRRGQLY